MFCSRKPYAVRAKSKRLVVCLTPLLNITRVLPFPTLKTWSSRFADRQKYSINFVPVAGHSRRSNPDRPRRTLMSRFRESDFIEIAGGLQYPEGPVWLPDGSLAAVDVKAGTLLRFRPDLANAGRFLPDPPIQLGGGPNGAALGPDGFLYVCNNGGLAFETLGPPLLPFTLSIPIGPSANYQGGSIQRVSLKNGSFETWCATNSIAPPVTSCLSPRTPLPLDPRGLRSPDDLVFDSSGGLWFTDWGQPGMFCRG